MKVKITCKSCGGTGLYQGFAKREHEAVVCIDCKGKGYTFFEFEPFEYRKKKPGIKTIKVSKGKFIAFGIGGIGESMTYSEFEKYFSSWKLIN